MGPGPGTGAQDRPPLRGGLGPPLPVLGGSAAPPPPAAGYRPPPLRGAGVPPPRPFPALTLRSPRALLAGPGRAPWPRPVPPLGPWSPGVRTAEGPGRADPGSPFHVGGGRFSPFSGTRAHLSPAVSVPGPSEGRRCHVLPGAGPGSVSGTGLLSAWGCLPPRPQPRPSPRTAPTRPGLPVSLLFLTQPPRHPRSPSRQCREPAWGCPAAASPTPVSVAQRPVRHTPAAYF